MGGSSGWTALGLAVAVCVAALSGGRDRAVAAASHLMAAYGLLSAVALLEQVTALWAGPRRSCRNASTCCALAPFSGGCGGGGLLALGENQAVAEEEEAGASDNESDGQLGVAVVTVCEYETRTTVCPYGPAAAAATATATPAASNSRLEAFPEPMAEQEERAERHRLRREPDTNLGLVRRSLRHPSRRSSELRETGSRRSSRRIGIPDRHPLLRSIRGRRTRSRDEVERDVEGVVRDMERAEREAAEEEAAEEEAARQRCARGQGGGESAPVSVLLPPKPLLPPSSGTSSRCPTPPLAPASKRDAATEPRFPHGDCDCLCKFCSPAHMDGAPASGEQRIVCIPDEEDGSRPVRFATPHFTFSVRVRKE